MREALGNPPFGRDPPPIWLPKWEEGEGHGVAVVRDCKLAGWQVQFNRSPRRRGHWRGRSFLGLGPTQLRSVRPPGGYMRRTVGIAAGIIGAAAITLVAASCGSDATAPRPKTYVANLSPAN